MLGHQEGGFLYNIDQREPTLFKNGESDTLTAGNTLMARMSVIFIFMYRSVIPQQRVSIQVERAYNSSFL